MARRPAARSGMALILALAAVVLAGGLALYLQARAATLFRAEQTELRWEQLRLSAAEAAREALWVLAADDDLTVDHLAEDWALPRETNRTDGIVTNAMVEDAGRFLNWNNVGVSGRSGRSARDMLLDLLMFCNHFDAAVPVEALEDFVDANETGSYEAPFYQTGDAPFRPPNRIMWAPAELLRVHGFKPDLFQPRPPVRRDDLFSGDLTTATAVVPLPLEEPLPVNVNTASREVLMALTGLEQDAAVRAVLALRQVRPFGSLVEIFTAYPELAAMLEGTVGTASTVFRVRARAAREGLACSVMAWVERDPDSGDIRILQWVEGDS